MVKQIVFRGGAVFFWLCLLSLFLYSPKIAKKFFSNKRSLNIFTFPQMIDAEYVHAFEKKTGIKLTINYYDNNDALLVKMRKTGGHGYDIIIPSDYAVEILAKEGLLKKLDTSKLKFLDNIDKRFLKKYFDPDNSYSIPYLWETYKIGISKKFFKNKKIEPSWGLAFDEQIAPHGIVMNNTAREAVLLAAFYLFGSIDNLDSEKIEKIKKLLMKQKKWVEAYNDVRSDYLLSSENAPLAVGVSGEIWHATRFDDNLDFVIPKEGTFMLIDSIALSAKSKKDTLAYEFINYLYTPEVMGYHVNKYSLFPVIKHIKMGDYFTESIKKVWSQTGKIDFFRNVLTENQLNNIWIDLKAN